MRARLQDQNSHHNRALECIRDTYRYEGVRGFYKGLAPYLIHVLPNICLVLLIYEKMTIRYEEQQLQEETRQQKGADEAAAVPVSLRYCPRGKSGEDEGEGGDG